MVTFNCAYTPFASAENHLCKEKIYIIKVVSEISSFNLKTLIIILTFLEEE